MYPGRAPYLGVEFEPLPGACWVAHALSVHETKNVYKKTHGYRNGVELAPEHTFANAANSTGGMSGLVGNTPFTGTGSNEMLGIIDEVGSRPLSAMPRGSRRRMRRRAIPNSFLDRGARSASLGRFLA